MGRAFGKKEKMACALTGAVIGAILIRIVVLLKRQAADCEEMTTRLERLLL